MKSHPLVPWEQQIGAEEQGKYLSAPAPWWCFRVVRSVKSVSGRCDLFHLVLPKPRVVRAAPQTASWARGDEKTNPNLGGRLVLIELLREF